MLPEQIRALIDRTPAIGFTGTRRVTCPALYAAVLEVTTTLSPLFHTAFVGDCTGVDRLVQRAAPNVRLMRTQGHRPFHLVQRSVRLVDELRQRPAALLIGYPACDAPPKLKPSAEPGRCFIGFGSGTWATIAYAVGCGLAVAVWLPESFAAPVTWPRCERIGEWLIVQPYDQLNDASSQSSSLSTLTQE